MTDQQALFTYCLRLGDDALIQSFRLSEWCSNAPILEEDLALTNFSLDMIGRAQALLSYAGQVEGKGRTDDDLAYRRGERQFFNHLIVELANGDFAFTIARQFLVSAFEQFYFTALLHSSDATLAAIAGKAIKEIRYHLAHAADWVARLGDGTQQSHDRIQLALNELWPYTGELFEQDDLSARLAESNIVPNLEPVKEQWEQYVREIIAAATLSVPESGYMQTGGSRSGIHTETLGHILSEMQYLQRAYPDAIW